MPCSTSPAPTDAATLRIRLLPAVIGCLLLASTADAADLFVAKSGSDDNSCAKMSSPCASVAHGIAAMSAGDTLIIGDGIYTDSITDMPSGSTGAYTSIRAANDWGVTIDGSAWPNTYVHGINITSKHYVQVRGIRVKMNQSTPNNDPVGVPYSDHVKIQRCSGSHGPTTGNAATFGIGPRSSYVLIEESYAYGGARYQFLVYQSDHVVVRRSVARNDYWNGTLQCAGFTNYDSVSTAWQNDIVLDSDTAHCAGRLYAGFFNENQPGIADDTSESFQGDIILNVQAFYAGILDWVAAGTHSLQDVVIWGSSGGYYGDQGPGLPANIVATRLTAGGLLGTYNVDGGHAMGTGVSVVGPIRNTFTNSVFSHCNSFGVADHTASDHNAFAANGANYGGAHMAVRGPHDRAEVSVTSSLRYLPRIEPESALKTAGSGGGQVGAEVMYMIGGSGTLHGDGGWDQLTTQPLWPFPNEDQIRADMASYRGPGAPGARGFATGKSLDGSPQTLTKYVWEYLGHQIPPEVYSLRIALGALPAAVVGVEYHATATAAGGSPPYTWSAAGSLPAGLSLDASTGTIAGTPTTAGSASFTIKVTDSRHPPRTASKTESVVITPGAGAHANSGAAGPKGANGVSQGCGCRPFGQVGLTLPSLLAGLCAVLFARRRR